MAAAVQNKGMHGFCCSASWGDARNGAAQEVGLRRTLVGAKAVDPFPVDLAAMLGSIDIEVAMPCSWGYFFREGCAGSEGYGRSLIRQLLASADPDVRALGQTCGQRP